MLYGRGFFALTSRGFRTLLPAAACRSGAQAEFCLVRRKAASVEFASSLNIATVPIQAGDLEMGGGRFPDEIPQHNVRLAAFWMGVTPVTQKQYRAIMGENPSRFVDDDLPVESVTWHEAVDFCERLSTKSGHRYQLPSEAQWEFACRAGICGADPLDAAATAVDQHAWHAGNSGFQPRPVGRKAPNPWGLYDMRGNVWEWCRSAFGKYPYTDQRNLENLQYPGPAFVLRGGSFACHRSQCAATYRNWSEPTTRDCVIGFRVCRLSG